MVKIVIAGVIVFIILNIGLFISYQHSLPVQTDNVNEQSAASANETEESKVIIYQESELLTQIWGFLGTETFKTVSLSLFLAVILSAIGGFFKVDQAIQERIKASIQKRIDTQTKCIEQTATMWDDLYCMVSEVRFYEYPSSKGDSPKAKENGDKQDNNDEKDDEDKKPTIIDLLKKLENYASKAEEVVNTWHFNFPKLSMVGIKFRNELAKDIVVKNPPNKITEKDALNNLTMARASGLILVHINILYNAAASVAYNIRDIEDIYGPKKEEEINKEIRKYQDPLGIIQDVIKASIHQYMLATLKYAVTPEDDWGHDKKSDKYAYNCMENMLTILFNKSKEIEDIDRDVMESAKENDASAKKANKKTKKTKRDDSTKNWEIKYDVDKLGILAKRLKDLYKKKETETEKKWIFINKYVKGDYKPRSLHKVRDFWAKLLKRT